MRAEIISLAKQFHLSVLSGGKFASSYDNSEECILEVLRAEAAAREKRAISERTKQARLPTFKSFKEFDTDFQKSITQQQLSTLESLQWVDQAFNLVLIGPPGTGKTHLALASVIISAAMPILLSLAPRIRNLTGIFRYLTSLPIATGTHIVRATKQ